MIRQFAVVLALLVLVGCGGGSTSSTSTTTPTPTPTATPIPTLTPTPTPANLVLTPGNWDFSAAGTVTGVSGAAFLPGGNISQTGSTVSGVFHLTNATCSTSTTDFPVTGTTTPNGATLNLPVEGTQGAITLHLTGTATSLNGSFTSTAGCVAADSGAVVGVFVPSLTASTWTGAFVTSIGPPFVNFSSTANLTQTAADIHGVAGVTGTATAAGNGCFAGLTVQTSSVIGREISITFANNDGSQTTTTGQINPQGTAKNISGTYNIVGGICDGDHGSFILSRP